MLIYRTVGHLDIFLVNTIELPGLETRVSASLVLSQSNKHIHIVIYVL